jgi:hypothetical protein
VAVVADCTYRDGCSGRCRRSELALSFSMGNSRLRVGNFGRKYFGPLLSEG